MLPVGLVGCPHGFLRVEREGPAEDHFPACPGGSVDPLSQMVEHPQSLVEVGAADGAHRVHDRQPEEQR